MSALLDLLAHVQVEPRTKAKLCVMAWLLWNAGNARVFQNHIITPSQLIRQLNYYVLDTNTISSQSPPRKWGNYHMPRHIPSLTSLTWLPPHFGGLMLDFDAAVSTEALRKLPL